MKGADWSFQAKWLLPLPHPEAHYPSPSMPDPGAQLGLSHKQWSLQISQGPTDVLEIQKAKKKEY